MQTALEGLPDDPAQLKAIILAQREEAQRMEASVRAYEALVQALKIRVARRKKQKFGPSSEKTEREIEQLQLALEDLEVAIAGQETEPRSEPPPSIARARPERRGKPRVAATTPRERIVLDPGEACPDCGGVLRLIGEDVVEILDFIEAKLKVVETARLKKSCRRCEKVVQTLAPTRPVARGMAGPGLLAHILVAKYDDHLLLYRQGEIFARMGAEIPRSTLIDWCGQAAAALRPLVDRISGDVFRSSRLHAADRPIRVLDPSVRTTRGKTRGVKEGRIWVYVRDDRPWSGADPPAADYVFSPDRKGAHPTSHLRDFSGILQADAYAGFRKLYQPWPGEAPKIREAACWAHLRQDFHDVWKATGSPIAEEALKRIGALYGIERDIWGQSAERRRAVRQEHSRPRAEAFRVWCETELARIPGKSDLARAIRYALARWPAFILFLEDGHVAIDNNAAERAIRPIAIGRKNFLFAGSDAGGETLADAMTVIETAKLSGLNPEAYLKDVLARINDHLINRLDDLLPWNWTPSAQRQEEAA